MEFISSAGCYRVCRQATVPPSGKEAGQPYPTKDRVGKLLKEKRRTEVVSEAGLEPATVSLEG
jgi:hypothetical protein